jgi:hypothetical protein
VLRQLLFGAITLAALGAASEAMACRYSPRPVTEEDVARADKDTLAAKAVIVRFEPEKPISHVPHTGFVAHFKIEKLLQGEIGQEFAVQYGPCQYIPGKIGESIYVLAHKDKNGVLQAPMSNK